jgi:hypothetical protein
MQGKLLHVVLHCTVVAGLGTPSDKDGAKLPAYVLMLVVDIPPAAARGRALLRFGCMHASLSHGLGVWMKWHHA